MKTRVENIRFLSWRIFFVGKYGIQSTNEMAFKRTVTLRASFRFSAISFDGPTLLSFSRFTHAYAKCPPVVRHVVISQLFLPKYVFVSCFPRVLTGSEWAGSTRRLSVKFNYFVGSWLKFSIFVGSRLNFFIFVGCRKISVNK